MSGYVRNITRHFQALTSLTVFPCHDAYRSHVVTGLQAGHRLGVDRTDAEQSAQRYWGTPLWTRVTSETFVFKATTEAAHWQATIALNKSSTMPRAKSDCNQTVRSRLLQIVRHSGEVVRLICMVRCLCPAHCCGSCVAEFKGMRPDYYIISITTPERARYKIGRFPVRVLGRHGSALGPRDGIQPVLARLLGPFIDAPDGMSDTN